MKMAEARLHHAHGHMDRAQAEELWREACFAFLTAALRGAPQKVMTERAAALWRAREDLMVLEQVVLPAPARKLNFASKSTEPNKGNQRHD
jgi:hypothetical protein